MDILYDLAVSKLSAKVFFYYFKVNYSFNASCFTFLNYSCIWVNQFSSVWKDGSQNHTKTLGSLTAQDKQGTQEQPSQGNNTVLRIKAM